MKARLPTGARVEPSVFLVAVLATAASFISVFSWFDPVAFPERAPSQSERRSPDEHVVFVTASEAPFIPRLAVRPSGTVRLERMPAATRDSARAVPSTSGIQETAVPVPRRPLGADMTPSPSLLPSAESHRRLAPFIILPRRRNPLAPQPGLTAAQRESVLFEIRYALPAAAATRIATREEQDSLRREMAAPGTIPGRKAGEQGLVGRAGGFPFPLFSAGPSRAERLRDSVANAEFMRLLSRLQDRVRLKRDSAHVAAPSP